MEKCDCEKGYTGSYRPTKSNMLVCDKCGKSESEILIESLQAENKELKEKIAVAENDGETLKRLIIFALFMQDGSGISEKSPDYVIQKYSLATVGNKPEAYLSDSNKMKLQEYFLQWGI